jgi:prepilin-type N-terminal cleavage/methylation domain-containing protein
MRASGQQGFTFIEVLQALSLSTIGLLALSSLTMGTIHANAKARRITTAATLAEAKMEELRNRNYAEVVEGTDAVTDTGVQYSRAWTVCTDCPIHGTKDVTLTVQWSEQATESVTLETIVAE